MEYRTKRNAIVSAIQESGLRLSLIAAGGGESLVSKIRKTPPGSQSNVEIDESLRPSEILRSIDFHSQSRFSVETARRLAVYGFFASDGNIEPSTDRFGLSPGHSNPLNVLACVAELTRGGIQEASPRFHLSVQNRSITRCVDITLVKDFGSPAEGEELVFDFGLSEIAKLAGLVFEVPDLPGIESLDSYESVAEQDWIPVFEGHQTACLANPEAATQSTQIRDPKCLLAGSFDPLHRGHLEMAKIGALMTGKRVQFELTIRNADKPPLDYVAIRNRVKQFNPLPDSGGNAIDSTLWLSNATTFAEKAIAFPQTTFLVGWDTVVRIADANYYCDDFGQKEAFRKISENGCRFLVFGRLSDGEFRTLKEASLPDGLRALCDEVPESVYRCDVSSTQIRNSSGAEKK